MPRVPAVPVLTAMVLAGAAALAAAGCGAGSSSGDAAPAPSTVAPATTVAVSATEPPTTTAPPTTTVAPSTTVASTTVAPTTAPPTTTSPTTAPPTTTIAPTTTTLPPRVYDFSAVGPIVQAYVDEHGLNGAGLIVVERDDGVVHHQHWGEFGPDRISLVASSSKMLVAGVLMNLHDRGLLDVDAPVADVAPWGVGNPDVTPVQLLSSVSGLVGLFPNPAYGPYLCQYLPIGTMQACAEQIFTTPDDDGDVVPPDTEFRYGGGQWQVAGAVAEVASGRTWAELIDEVYVQPCGLDVLAFNNPFTQFDTPPFSYPTGFAGDPGTLVATDNPNMEGGAYVTTGAYGALLLMYLRDGMCGDDRVLTVGSVERLLADRTGVVLGDDDDGVLAYGVGVGYGLGWWVDRATGRRSDGGAYGSMPWLDTATGYGAYLVLEATSGQGRELAERLYDAVEGAVLAARGEDGPAES